MTTTSDIFDPVKVFCSYSHTDELLKLELDKHLETLKRTGLIEFWHDRRITPGERWENSIDQNLRNAEIVLLLTSSDFLASKYCFAVECSLALERQAKGEAIVIPVLLRSVDLKGLQVSELHALPRNGKPVELWNNRDEAFKNIADGLREVVQEVVRHRVRSRALDQLPTWLREARVLDAAIAHEIPVGKFREILALVRLAESEGLKVILSEDSAADQRKYSCDPSQVRSESFSASFRPMADGDLESFSYRIGVVAPDLEIADGPKSFTLLPRRESMVFKFLVKANSEGEYRVRVDLFEGSQGVAEGLLSTSATLHGPDGGPGRASHLLASVQLVARALARAAWAG